MKDAGGRKMTIRELLNLVVEGKAPDYVYFNDHRYARYTSGEYYSDGAGENLITSVFEHYNSVSSGKLAYLVGGDIITCDHLTEEEKSYLCAVLRPFRERAPLITKIKCGDETERIRIAFNEKHGLFVMFFPEFKSREMYRRLVRGHGYTPKELGLWEDDQ